MLLTCFGPWDGLRVGPWDGLRVEDDGKYPVSFVGLGAKPPFGLELIGCESWPGDAVEPVLDEIVAFDDVEPESVDEVDDEPDPEAL